MTHLVRDRLTWLLYAQLGVFGYFLYGFGPVVPLLRDELNVSRTVAGLYGPALAVGAIVGGTLFPYLVRRLRPGGALWAGLAGVAAGVALLCLAPSIAGTLVGAVVALTGGIVVVSGVSTALTAHHGPAAAAGISEANALAAGMGLLAPLLIGAAVASSVGWRAGLAVTVALAGLLAALTVLSRVRIPATPVPDAGRPGEGRLPSRYWLAWACLLATGSAEVSLSLWASEQLREHAGMAPGAAAAGMSAVLVGMVAGRLAGGRLALRVATVPLMFGALAGCAAGFALFWVASTPWLAITGLVACGLGMSVHFPLGVTLAIRASGGQPELAMARTAYGMALGFGVAPLALGALADRIGISWAFLLVPFCLLVAAGAVWQLNRVAGDGLRGDPATRAVTAPGLESR